VIGGDGADEIFLGNDVFKERGPESRAPLLDCAEPGDPLFSHLPRFLSSRIGDFYTSDFKAALSGTDVIGELRASLPTRFFAWSPLNQAAYLEMTTLLSPYLLSSHGDRMTAAHGLEGRYPFLDHRVFEFASALPTGSRLRGLHGKELLRRWASRILPRQIEAGGKARYRVPDAQCFFLPTSPSWIGDHLTPEALGRVGIFSASTVGGLVRRCRAGLAPLGETQAMVAVLSTQLWHHQFVESALFITPLPAAEASVLLGDSVPVLSPNTSTTASHADTGN